MRVAKWGRIAVLAGLMAGIWLAAWTKGPRDALTKMPERAERATFAGGCFWCM